MDLIGLSRATRYSYPPNSLSLCGPLNQKNLGYYASTGNTDEGTAQLLEKFSTLYPYLCLIAGENHLKDPFDRRVVEAYWLGNNLLDSVSKSTLIRHMSDTVGISRKQSGKENERISKKIVFGGLPHHAFHVLNVYFRTGNHAVPHTVETMDACIINYGKVVTLLDHKVIVVTKPLRQNGDLLEYGSPMQRLLNAQGSDDKIFKKLNAGDWISYHWGYVCEKITTLQQRNLMAHTTRALQLANTRM